MARVKALRREDGSVYGYELSCPGCAEFVKARGCAPPGSIESAIDEMVTRHVVPTSGPVAWGFNGDVDRPTFSPSILVYGAKRDDGTVYQPRCHSWVRDGRIEFCADSAHPLAGQSVELPEIEVDT